MKQLKQITIAGLGLLGGSTALSVLRSFPGAKVVGWTHRASTRRKARELAVATEVVDDLKQSVSEADLVILATPISTFEEIFTEIADVLPAGCIVTDVGSTKVLPQRWAAKRLSSTVHYVGSHPIAGSEQRGVEFSRDDLFEDAMCVLATTEKSDRSAVQTLKEFWTQLGCFVKLMNPVEHDRILANVSHLPHIIAAALINANTSEDLKLAGKGFMDTSRIASGPVNIWSDIVLANPAHIAKGIDRTISELSKIKKAIKAGDKEQVEKLLTGARDKRGKLISYRMKRKELQS